MKNNSALPCYTLNYFMFVLLINLNKWFFPLHDAFFEFHLGPRAAKKVKAVG